MAQARRTQNTVWTISSLLNIDSLILLSILGGEAYGGSQSNFS